MKSHVIHVWILLLTRHCCDKITYSSKILLKCEANAVDVIIVVQYIYIVPIGVSLSMRVMMNVLLMLDGWDWGKD